MVVITSTMFKRIMCQCRHARVKIQTKRVLLPGVQEFADTVVMVTAFLGVLRDSHKILNLSAGRHVDDQDWIYYAGARRVHAPRAE